MPLPCPVNRQHYRRDVGCIRVRIQPCLRCSYPVVLAETRMITSPPNRLLWSRELPQARFVPNPRAVAYVEHAALALQAAAELVERVGIAPT